MAYGITPQGFVGKDLQTIKSELEALFKGAWGDDLDVSAESVAGQLIGNLSLKFVNIWELAAAIYASFNPDTASDTSLDRVGAMVNAVRLGNTATEVIVAMYGAEGAVIPQGHMTGQEIGTVFLLGVATTITKNAAIDVTVEIPSDITPTEEFTLSINGVEFSYVVQVDDTKLDVLNELKALIDAVTELNLDTEIAEETLRIWGLDGMTAFLFAPSENFTVSTLATPGRYLCQTLGKISVPSGTVTVILQPVSGLDSVYNFAAGTPGRNIENDIEFRTRRRNSLFANGFSTDEAIRSRLLEEVDDVTYVRVYSNREDAVDADGRPGHSTEVVVLGGNDTDIAKKLWQVWPAGTGFFGNTEITIQDSVGDDQIIKFSRPVPKYIWVQVELTLSLEESFPIAGKTTVKNNIVNWALSAQNPGVDVLFQKLYKPIYDVPGIDEASVQIGVTDDPNTPPVSWVQANIAISSSQLALFDLARIEVNTL